MEKLSTGVVGYMGTCTLAGLGATKKRLSVAKLQNEHARSTSERPMDIQRILFNSYDIEWLHIEFSVPNR
jgi:hypothetical protein